MSNMLVQKTMEKSFIVYFHDDSGLAETLSDNHPKYKDKEVIILQIGKTEGNTRNTIAELIYKEDYKQEAEHKCKDCSNKDNYAVDKCESCTDKSNYKAESEEIHEGKFTYGTDYKFKLNQAEPEQSKARFKRIADVYVNIDEHIHNIRSEKDMWGKEYATYITYKDGRSTYISLPISKVIQQLGIEVV